MDLIYKIINTLKVLTISKRGLLSIFNKSTSVSSTLILHNIKHFVPTINTILDVGANKGQFALTSTHIYPNAKIYSFEPVPDTYIILKNRIKNTNKVSSYNFALGNSEEEINFYSNQYSHASSALPVSEFQKEILPQTSKEKAIKVQVKKLDDIFTKMQIHPPVLLKLDVQGFEKEVLKGAIESLKQIDYLVFESSFVTMYEGEPLFDEMHSFVKHLGFELVAPVGFLQTNELQILQMDILYKRVKK